MRKREIARAGTFGTKDNPRTVFPGDIKELAETFADVKTAPVQFGHNANAAAPRLGQVVNVYCDDAGKTLYADIEEHDVLADAVDAGYYPDVSIGAQQSAADGKMYLHHLAYLGQEAPGIKTLIADIKTPLGIAAADAGRCILFPSPTDRILNFSDSIKEDHAVTKEEAEQLRRENKRLKEQLQTSGLLLSDAVQQKKSADKERLAAAMNGKITKANQWKVFEIADAFEPGKTLELSDPVEGQRKAAPLDLLIEVINAQPFPVQTGIFNFSDSDAKRDYSSLRNKG